MTFSVHKSSSFQTKRQIERDDPALICLIKRITNVDKVHYLREGYFLLCKKGKQNILFNCHNWESNTWFFFIDKIFVKFEALVSTSDFKTFYSM